MRPALPDFGAIETINTSSTHRLFQRNCYLYLRVSPNLFPTLTIADKHGSLVITLASAQTSR
jgi:hypothetical protein